MTSGDRKQIRIWYWSGAVLVFIILVIGGITRLTQSGLSMVEWNPIMGVIPPLSEQQWLETFEKYKEFPEYQQRNRGMELAEFQFIFFWEYLHRMAGRLLGLVFLIPFAYFLVKKKFSTRQLKRAVLLLGLGLSQGLLGWFMVQSGLVDVPYVSPYRLAAHLALAFIIFGCCVWFALDLYEKQEVLKINWKPGLQRVLLLFTGLLILQVIWGAFVAGHHAGHVYNTFPKMNQFWIPPEAWLLEPMILNFFENSAAVQWMHRLMGTLLGIMALLIWGRIMFFETGGQLKIWAVTLMGVVLIQYVTGVYTLLYHVPVVLGVIHQSMAMILFGVVLAFYYKIKKSSVAVTVPNSTEQGNKTLT